MSLGGTRIVERDSTMSDVSTFNLGENGKAVAADALKAFYLEAKGRPVIIDADGVNFISSMHLQVHIAAENDWREQGQTIQIVNQSEQLQACLATLGWSQNAQFCEDK